MNQMALGLLFWLGFVLVLEPGNVVRAADSSIPISWAGEALRMTGAGVLGAPTLPLMLWLSRRLRVHDRNGLRNGVLLGLCIFVLATALILIAAVIARWLPPTSVRGGFPEQLARNLLLLIVALAIPTIAVQIGDWGQSDADAPPIGLVDRVPIRSRSGTILLSLSDVDWIEAQGNYLALHVGASTHLIRETLARLEARLDQSCFMRVHRGAVVNLARVRHVRPIGRGDAMIGLDTGQELRLSRNHSRTFTARLHAQTPHPPR